MDLLRDQLAWRDHGQLPTGSSRNKGITNQAETETDLSPKKKNLKNLPSSPSSAWKESPDTPHALRVIADAGPVQGSIPPCIAAIHSCLGLQQQAGGVVVAKDASQAQHRHLRRHMSLPEKAKARLWNWGYPRWLRW